MPKTETALASAPDLQRKFPVVCKTWREVEEIKRQYLKPLRYGPKGQPIYDHAAVARYVIFPKD